MRPVYRSEETVGGSVPNKGLTTVPLIPLILLLSAIALAGVASAQEPELAEVSETVTVTDTRLRDRPETEREIPAHVTILAGEDLERATVQTLQDLLADEAGVVLFDQVGDDVSKTLDLRGFGGTGVRVFLNGAPLNEPRNNTVALELVPLLQLERVEITRGSTAALAGGGSEGGVINLWTRRGEDLGGSVSVAAGDFGTLEVSGLIENRFEVTDLTLSASHLETDGFRDNANGDLRRLALDAGWSLGDGQRVDLSVLDAAGDFGNPGALTVEESRGDRSRAPFNALDFTDETFSQAALNYTAVLTESWSLSANLFARDSATEALTTGRSAPAFGGFLLGTDSRLIGSTLQLGRDVSRGGRGNYLSAGLEWLDGETEAEGFGTPPDDLDLVSPAGRSSDNLAERQTLALYLQDRWSPLPRLTLTAGARYDQDEVAYRESFPDPLNGAAREFSELSLRAGATWSLTDEHSLYASFGEAFLPPTVEELFSFPLFGSNPGLEPQDSRSVEAGYRGRWGGRRSLDVALFQIDTEDEIVFDPDSPLGLFGANVNIGKALRRGLEVAVRGDLSEGVRAFANVTLMDSEFKNGVNRGKALPLVPEQRLSLGVDVDLPRSLHLRAVALHVGEQVLDNDDANSVPPLVSYTTVNARLSWSTARELGVELFVDARNLFDETYASRGIFAFDFQTFTNAIFLTPAPGRRIMGGLGWRF